MSSLSAQSFCWFCHEVAQILIMLKWIIVSHDHAANQLVALLGLNILNNLGYLTPDLRVSVR